MPLMFISRDLPSASPTGRSFLLRVSLLTTWALFIAACGLSAYGQEEDDEDDEFRSGLIATYSDRSGQQVVRVDRTLSFAWDTQPPDERLAERAFQARWDGLLMSEVPGEYRLHAYVEGELRVSLNDAVLLDVTCEDAKWVSSTPIELPFDWHPLVVEYRTSDPAGRLGLYWSGPKFELEPIPPRNLYHDPHQPPPDDLYERGSQLARALRCAACHADKAASAAAATTKVSDFLPAPSLTHISGNIHREWLIPWLMESEHAQQDGGAAVSRRMPMFDVPRADAEALAAYLLSRSEPAPKRKAPQGDRERGERLFLTLGCLACHRAGELGEEGLFGGGDLTHIGAKRPAEFFSEWLEQPERINADHRMPVFEVSRKERADLAEYLSSLGDAPSAKNEQPADPALIARGQTLFMELRCNACHATGDGPAGAKVAGVGRLGHHSDWSQSCAGGAEPDRNRPGYDLSEEGAQAVRHYFGVLADRPTTPAGPVRAESLLVENNCLSCHTRDGVQGIESQLTEVAAIHPDLAGLVPGMSPPSLTSVGDKLYRQALKDAIKRSEGVERPYLSIRMPKFDLAERELEMLVDHFIQSDRIPERPRPAPEPAPEPVNEPLLRVTGAQLVIAGGFGCTSCHQVGDSIPNKAPITARGPSLSMFGKRIRRAWFDRFVRYSVRVVPRTRMPSVQQPVHGVLGEELDRQLAAVWFVLNRPDFQPPDPDPVRIVRRRGVSDQPERAAVLTDVLQAREKEFIKPLVIGLSNRHSILFDLATAQLAGWWTGDVAHQQTKGKTWFWQPGGVSVIPFGAGAAELLVSEAGNLHEPLQTGQFVTEADFWQHTDHGLRFGYRLVFPSDEPSTNSRQLISVEQTFTPLTSQESQRQSGFRREVRASGLRAGGQLALRTLDLSTLSSFDVSQNGRELVVNTAAKVHVRVQSPEHVAFSSDGLLMAEADQHGQIDFVLTYATELPIQPYLVPDPEFPSPAPVRLHVVPGYEAIRLPISPTVMPISLGWKPDGTLLVGSLKGRVWLLRDTDGDGLEDDLQELSDELASPYGIVGYDDYVDVINKFALVRLFDDDDDGRADRTVTLASGWGHTTDYHDWVVGVPRDEQGNYYLALPCQQDERSDAAAHLRGKVVRLIPREPTADDPRQFRIEPISGGHRFPMGIARNRAGDLFVTDNQGNYNPFNELNHVMPGARYGFINALERKPGFSPPLTPPAINIPHPWTRSVNGIAFLDTPPQLTHATGRDHFGPFEGHLIGCELNTRRLVRMTLQRVGETYQGAVYPFSYDEPPEGPPMLGPVVCGVAPDGDLYVGNLRDSGWGLGNNIGSLLRLRPQEGELPTGIAEVRAVADGFAIDFTGPVDPQRAADAENYSISSYTRISTPAYGGDDQDRRTEHLATIDVSPDATRVTLRLGELRPGYVYEFRLRDLATQELFPAEAHYTLRSLPE